MNRAIFPILVLWLLAVLPASSVAVPSPVVIRDTSGCGVVDPAPRPGASITWSGACKDGLAEGTGTLQWLQLNVLRMSYVGAMSGGLPTGPGTEAFANGARFEGTFAAGRRQGHGVFTWPDRTRYEGDFVGGEMTGQGVMDMDNGLRYEGTFNSARMTGQGVLSVPGIRLETLSATDAEALPKGTPGWPRIANFQACKPQYPPLAVRAQATGTSSLALLVDVDGHVQGARIEQPSGDDFPHKLMDMTALAALARCPIVPGSLDGKPAARWMNVRYEWRLD